MGSVVQWRRLWERVTPDNGMGFLRTMVGKEIIIVESTVETETHTHKSHTPLAQSHPVSWITMGCSGILMPLKALRRIEFILWF